MLILILCCFSGQAHGDHGTDYANLPSAKWYFTVFGTPVDNFRHVLISVPIYHCYRFVSHFFLIYLLLCRLENDLCGSVLVHQHQHHHWRPVARRLRCEESNNRSRRSSFEHGIRTTGFPRTGFGAAGWAICESCRCYQKIRYTDLYAQCESRFFVRSGIGG